MIRFRAIRIASRLQSGEIAYFETTFDTAKRLFVIHGGNSEGKSLLMSSMIYGLGLEGAYGPGNQYGLLTRALTDSVDLNGETFSVQSSSVSIELQNDRSDILTIHRPVIDEDSQDGHLVTVQRSAALTLGENAPTESYYVRWPGSARNERGFHTFLADFLGWDLPLVGTFDGSETLLYLELITPFFVVEQKSGWAGIMPRLATYLRVREPAQRVVEFLLGASDGETIRASQQASEEVSRLRTAYAQKRSALLAVASLHAADIVGLPETPPVGRVTPPGKLQIGLRVLRDNEWVDVTSELERLEHELSKPPVGIAPEPDAPDAERLEAQLRESERELGEVGARTAALEETMDMVNAQLGTLHTRIQHVDEELRRYEELRTLVSLGSSVIAATIARNDCPTCHQSLLGIEHVDASALDYDDSIAMLRRQAATLQALQADAASTSERHAAVRAALDQRSRELRAHIRALRTDLQTPADVPSISDLQARVAANTRHDALAGLRDEVIVAEDEMNGIAASLDRAVRHARSLAPQEFPDESKDRLRLWNERFRSLLTEFGFSTLTIADISIDETGKPSHQGYDIAFQGSASDGIRLKWAYLTSLMETLTTTGGAHPGLLLLDEPRQQEVAAEDVGTLFRRLASLPHGQVIVATSEPVDRVQSWLGEESAELISVSPLLLRRAPSEA